MASICELIYNLYILAAYWVTYADIEYWTNILQWNMTLTSEYT